MRNKGDWFFCDPLYLIIYDSYLSPILDYTVKDYFAKTSATLERGLEQSDWLIQKVEAVEKFSELGKSLNRFSLLSEPWFWERWRSIRKRK